MAKTQKQLEEERDATIAYARSEYNGVIKPAQEKFKIAEHNARVILELTTKPLYGLIQPIEPGEPGEPASLKLDYVSYQYNMVIDSAENAYRAVVAKELSNYNAIEEPAKHKFDAEIKLADDAFYDAIEEIYKIREWFKFRRTYQKSHGDPFKQGNDIPAFEDTSSNISMMLPIPELPIPNKQELKCYFCGTSEARAKAALNRVKYKLKHPGARWWQKILGRDWKYACHDCVNYMISLHGPLKVVVVDDSVPVDITDFCKNGQHIMCGGLACNCECHTSLERQKQGRYL